MILLNNMIKLPDLARALGVSSSALLQHLQGNSGLSEGAVKSGNGVTDCWLLPVGSVLKFLGWAKGKARKIDKDTIMKLEEELRCLKLN